MNRENLPFRKNCEGYFTKENKILAKDSEKGHVIFPGGGIEEKETPEQALLRETFEETGAIINSNLKKLGTLKIIWHKTWAKTEKQKARYEQYQGDEMHFFLGEIKEFKQATGDSEDINQNQKIDAPLRSKERGLIGARFLDARRVDHTRKDVVSGRHDRHDIWKSKKLVEIERAIELIEKSKPFPKESEKYHNFQLRILNELKNKIH